MSLRKPWIWFFLLVLGVKSGRSFVRRVVRKLTGRQPDHYQDATPRLIPKVIWIFWDTGEESAPDIVKFCIESWRQRNPGWTVNVLDRNTASEAVQLPVAIGDVQIQTFADLLRCRLLNEHGGVWADATAYCVLPLDSWLPMAAQRGFFAFVWAKWENWFTWPGFRRHLANWFLASEPAGTVIKLWDEFGLSYWENRSKAHLYFWPHVIFETLLFLRPDFRRAFAEVPKFGCLGPHLVHDAVIRERDLSKVSQIVSSGAAPVQKLSWKWSDEQIALAKSLVNCTADELRTHDALKKGLEA